MNYLAKRITPGRKISSSVLIIVFVLISSCTSFPEKISREKFTLEDANKAGFETELIKTAVQPDGKIVVLAAIKMRDDRNSHRLYLKVQRYHRDGKLDDSFRCDDFFIIMRLRISPLLFLLLIKKGIFFSRGF